MGKIGKFFSVIRFLSSLISSVVLIVLPLINMANNPSDAKIMKNSILACVAFVVLMITLVSQCLDKKHAKQGRKIAGKVRSLGKLVANIAMLVVLLMTWNDSRDLSLLLPLTVTSVTVAISLTISFFSLLVSLTVSDVKRRVTRRAGK